MQQEGERLNSLSSLNEKTLDQPDQRFKKLHNNSGFFNRQATHVYLRKAVSQPFRQYALKSSLNITIAANENSID